MGYTVVTVIVAIVLWIIIGAVTGLVTNGLTRGANLGGPGAATVTLPGGERVQTGGLEEAARRMEEASARMAEGRALAAADPADLAALLPACGRRAGPRVAGKQPERCGGVEHKHGRGGLLRAATGASTLTVTDLGDMAALGRSGRGAGRTVISRK